jgi:transposase-like protein
MPSGRNWTPAERADILKRSEGMKYTELKEFGKKNGIHEMIIYAWRAKLRKHGTLENLPLGPSGGAARKAKQKKEQEPRQRYYATKANRQLALDVAGAATLKKDTNGHMVYSPKLKAKAVKMAERMTRKAVAEKLGIRHPARISSWIFEDKRRREQAGGAGQPDPIMKLAESYERGDVTALVPTDSNGHHPQLHLPLSDLRPARQVDVARENQLLRQLVALYLQ